MTRSKLFRILHRVDDISTALSCVQMRIEKLEGCLQGRAIRYDVDKVQTSPKDPVAEVMGDLEGLLKKQTKLQIALTRAVGDTAALLDKLTDNKQLLIMHYRYVSGVSWSVIADRVGVSERHVYRLHDKAVDYLCKNN